MNDGANFVPFYPWSEGDRLYASALNAAIANSVALGGDNTHFRTPYDFGARGVVGGVPTDDTAALNTAFAQTSTEGGGRIYFPDTFYAAGALTVPPNVEIYGNFSPVPTPSGDITAVSYFQVGGSKLILGTGGITLGSGCVFRNIMVVSHGLPATNPTTVGAANAMLAAMPANGTGITLMGSGCLLDTIQVLGFNFGIYGATGTAMNRQMFRNVHGDNINGIHLANGGDTCRIQGAHFWPYLTFMVPGGSTGASWLQRSGDGIYTSNSGCNVQIAQCCVFGWQRCYVADADSVYWSQCWSDGNAPQSAGFTSVGACGTLQMSGCTAVANQFGVHHSVSNGAVFNIDAGTTLVGGGPGGSTPATGMSIGVLADGHGSVQCMGAYFNGGNAAFYLGPNSGPSVIMGNIFDFAGDALGYVWYVDPAVVPLLTKHSNRVINSLHGKTEQVPPNQANSLPLWDSLSGTVTGLSSVGAIAVGASAGSPITPAFQWISAGNGTDQNNWDVLSSGDAISSRTLNDAGSAANVWLGCNRTGNVPGTISLAGQAVALGGSATGFNGTSPIPKPTVSGAKGGNAALNSLLIALSAYGLVIDSTTA